MAARAEQAVDLVDEEDRGRQLRREREVRHRKLVRLSEPLREESRRVERDEGDRGLLGDGTREECLARARRPVQQDALGRAQQLRLAKELRVRHGQQDVPLQLPGDVLQPTDVGEGDVNLARGDDVGRDLELVLAQRELERLAVRAQPRLASKLLNQPEALLVDI